jgi:hypothetical protein
VGNRRKPTIEKQAKLQTASTDRVVLGHVHPGQVSSYFQSSRENMLMYDVATSRHIVGREEEWSSANISTARNLVVERFLQRDADWLLFMDADMAFEHDALERLLAVADPATAPIVGGLCFGATYGRLFPTIYQFVEVDGAIKTIRVDDYPDDSLVQCAATGAAFLLIHRSALEAIRDKAFNAVFPWFQETELAGQPAGEDLTFCIRAGICGLPIYVDTGVKVGHHKSTVLDHDTFQAQKEAMAHVGGESR